jgi:hypothetical protein
MMARTTVTDVAATTKTFEAKVIVGELFAFSVMIMCVWILMTDTVYNLPFVVSF